MLKTIAKSAGYGLQIAPDVEGQVNVHLENVAFTAALRALLEPIDLGFELQAGSLLVYRRGLVTRWFNFDYPVTQREGRGELRISGRGQSQSESGGGSQDQNESHVTSSAAMAIWPEIMQALETLVFDHSRTETATPAAGAGQSLSLADGEGRSLLVSPMAGVIQATAEVKRLGQVEGYLDRMRGGAAAPGGHRGEDPRGGRERRGAQRRRLDRGGATRGRRPWRRASAPRRVSAIPSSTS